NHGGARRRERAPGDRTYEELGLAGSAMATYAFRQPGLSAKRSGWEVRASMSDKPVAERLQVKSDRRLAVIGASAALEKTVGAGKRRADLAEADVVLLFVPDRAHLDAKLPGILKTMPGAAILWVAYPKLSSKLAADLSRDVIHALAPRHGLDTVSQ